MHERDTRKECGQCGATLNRYSEGELCRPCSARRADSQDSDPPSIELASHLSRNDKVTEILGVARSLLSDPPPGLNGVACPFVLRFIAADWQGPFGELARRFVSAVQAEGNQKGPPLHIRHSMIHAAQAFGVDVGKVGSQPRFMDITSTAIRPGVGRFAVRSSLVDDQAIRGAIRAAVGSFQDSDTSRDSLREWLNAARDYVHGSDEPTMPDVTSIGVKYVARFGDSQGLPSIVVEVEVDGDPKPAHIFSWFKHQVFPIFRNRLWDAQEDRRRRRPQEPTILIREWTLFTLQDVAGVGQRDSMRCWKSIAPDGWALKTFDEPPEGKGRENQASEEVARVDGLVRRLRAMLDL